MLWSRLVNYLKERTQKKNILGTSVYGPFKRWAIWKNYRRAGKVLMIPILLGIVFLASYWLFGQLLNNLAGNEDSIPLEEPVQVSFKGEEYSEFYTLVTVAEQNEEQIVEEEIEEWQWPLWGVLENGFGWTYSETLESWVFHEGIDILSVEGEKILAVSAGVVKDIFFDSQLGLSIVVDHGDGLESIYASCRSSFVEPGQEVSRGEVLAEVGDSALYEAKLGYHLHFAVRLTGEYLDPLMYLPR